MNAAPRCCPGCGSARIASRRALFQALMTDRPLVRGFNWYSESTPGACPPRSLSLMLAVPMGLVGLFTAALWMLGAPSALTWLPGPLLILLSCLVYDRLRTLRRYRAWGSQWLCGECRAVFGRLHGGREMLLT